MQWYRFYDEALDDPKVQQLPPTLFKHWVNLLCLANKGTPRGTIKQDYHAIAFRLRVSESEACEIIKALTDYDLIEATDDGKLIPHNWENRQRKSDSSADRVAAHRERLKGSNDTETLLGETLQRNSNALEQNREETETETETELNTPPTPQGERGSVRNLEWVLQRVKSGKCTKRDPPPYVAEFDAFWAQVVRKEPSKKEAYWSWLQVLLRGEEPPGPEDVLAGLGRMVPVWDRFEDKTKIPHITTWLNQDRWTVERPTGPTRASPARNGRATAQDFIDLMHEDAHEPPGHAETVIDAAYSVSNGQALGSGRQRDGPSVGRDAQRR